MIHIRWIEAAGYTASLLVFCTFYMKTMIPLRTVAIASNVAFMAYGFGGRLYPVLILHAILLPLNIIRLRQMRALIRKVREAARGNMSMEWLIPHMSRLGFEPGHVLFRKGDPANTMYLILEGSIRLEELGVSVGKGALLGEIGLFAPENRRTATALCEGDVHVGAITDAKVMQLYYQNPTFGFYLVRLVIERLLENDRLRRSVPAAQPS